MDDNSPSAPARLGRYELLGKLATGGMAEIHLARLAGEAGFEKIVVVKRLLPELVASPSFVEMFLAEGKLVARLDHPNICEVHELGRDGHEYFLVMPYLDGLPINKLIARDLGAAPDAHLRMVASVVIQACAGLHHAHEARRDGAWLGLVHRDVSPSNLFLTTAGMVKVLDFGIAKVRGSDAQTEVGMVKGKAHYMAPEQVLGKPLDRRCDIFALGIVLFELATGTRLFSRDSDYLTARAILEDPIPRADAVDPHIPGAVADVIATALARHAEDRYQDAAALATALATALAPIGGPANAAEVAAILRAEHEEELIIVRTRQTEVLAHAPLGTANHTALPTTPRRRAGPSRRLMIGATVALAASAIVTAFAVGRGSAGSTAAGVVPAPPADAGAARVAVAVPTDAAVVAVVAVAAPDARPAAAPPPAPPPPPPHHVSATPGRVSIDSNPYARIDIDGHGAGVTPILGAQLTPGRHRVRATLADGRIANRVILIEPGRAAPPLLFSW